MAGSIKGIIVEIGGETSGLQKALSKVNSMSKSLSSELKNINSSLRLNPSNVTILAQKQEVLKEKITNTSEALNKLKSVQDQTYKKWQNYLKVEPQLKKITEEIGQTEKELEKLQKEQDKAREAFEKGKISKETYQKITDEVNNCKDKLKSLRKEQKELSKDTVSTENYRAYQREIANTESELKKLKTEQKNFGSVTAQVIAVAGEKIKGLGSTIENVGKKLAGLSTGATVALGGIVKSSIDFESAWTGVTKTVDGTDEELAKVRSEILKLASATGTSSSEIAGVAEAAGQLGVGVKDVSAFTETMVRLGDSTNLSADEAATAIAQFYNIMKQDLSTVDNFGSALVALGNNSATSESKIMDMASRIAGAGSQIGLSSQQVLALSASLASVGLEAEGGGSAISQVMTQIDKDVALNSKNLKTWAKTSGMSVKDFSKLWKEDTMGALQAVIKGMGETTDKGGNLNVLLDELGITSIRQTDTMKRLSNASDLLNDSLNIANTAWEQNTALTDESQKRYETTAAKIGQVKETLKEVGISLGEVVLPVIQEWADKIKEVVEKFTSLDDTTKENIVKALLLVAALSPLLVILGKLTTGLDMLMTTAPKVASAFNTVFLFGGKLVEVFKLVAGGAGTLHEALSVVFGSVGTMVAGIVGVLGGIALAVKNFVSMLTEGFSWVKEALMVVGIAIAAVGTVILGVPATVAAVVAAVIAVVATLVVVVKEHWEDIKNFFANIADVIVNFFTVTIPDGWNKFLIKLQELWDNIKQKVTDGWNVISVFFTETIPNALRNFWDSVVNFFTEGVPNLIDKVMSWISELPYKIGYQLGLIIGNIVQFGADVWKWITTRIPEFISKIVAFVSELPGKIWTFLLDIINKVIKWGQTIWNNAKTYTTNLINDVTTYFSQLPLKIWNHLLNVLDTVSFWGSNLIARGREAASNLVNTVHTTIASLPGRVAEVGRNIVEGLWNGIQGAGDWIRGKVGEFARGILDGMKAALGIHSPSKLFRDEVGKYIALGVGEGFLDNIGRVTKSMQNKLDLETGKISSNLNVAAQVGTGSLKSSGDTVVTVNFYPQKMTDAELDNAFNYINRKFGMVY